MQIVFACSKIKLGTEVQQELIVQGVVHAPRYGVDAADVLTLGVVGARHSEGEIRFGLVGHVGNDKEAAPYGKGVGCFSGR